MLVNQLYGKKQKLSFSKLEHNDMIVHHRKTT